jgi:hypothetical protein
MLSPLIDKARFEILGLLDTCPVLFPLQMRFRRSRALAVTEDMELVIEGYPRSANTFAVAALLESQGRPVAVGRHLHSPAHVIRATRAGLPTLVLVRRPPDPILSLVVRSPFLSVRQALRSYIRFYETIEPFAEGFLTVRFEDAINDFGTVIERTNLRFGTNFLPFIDTPESRAAVAERIEMMEREDSGSADIRESSVARPSAERDRLKADLMGQYEAPTLATLRSRADAVYQRYLAHQPS